MLSFKVCKRNIYVYKIYTQNIYKNICTKDKIINNIYYLVIY